MTAHDRKCDGALFGAPSGTPASDAKGRLLGWTEWRLVIPGLFIAALCSIAVLLPRASSSRIGGTGICRGIYG
jgi:hypothetical protein